MVDLKCISNPINLRSGKTQLIITSLIFVLSLLILLYSPLIFKSLQSITSATLITSQLLSPSNNVTSLSPLPNPPIIIPLNTTGQGSSLVLRSNNGSFCDIFDGRWVLDNDFDPFYSPGSCPFVGSSFNCFKNGRSDLDYLRYRWQPHGCDIPRFDGERMLEMLRGKRMVLVGDSLNRNMWESLVCSLRMPLVDRTKLLEVSGANQFKTKPFYSSKFKDYNCTIEYISSPFLVQQWRTPKVKGVETQNETLRLDMIQDTVSKYYDADFLIFNTGHWWTHQKVKEGERLFQEGEFVHSKMDVGEAYTKALHTWAKWVDKNVNKNKTLVFFAGFSATHFSGAQWNSRGNCDGETKPITNDKFLRPYPWMMSTLESVISKMRTPVVYLNLTKMTDYRKDGHPSIYLKPKQKRSPRMRQDCSHWCLPGIPDSWNQLLYASLLHTSNKSIAPH